MQPKTLKELLQRARRVTSERGKPAQLAKRLDVSRSRVSDWLNGKFEPSGDVILQLSEWVQGEEAKQKSPGSALTPPERKTRRKVSDETKPTSGRRKK